MALSRDHYENILAPRGISAEVVAAVPERYDSWERGDFDAFVDLMEYDNPKWGKLPEPKRPSWKGKVTQAGGFVIRRWGPKGNVLPPYGRADRSIPMGKSSSTKYLYRSGYSRKHIDVHPLVAPKLDSGKPIYLALEGSLKADAILSAGGAAISSTSVTTWQSPDLRTILPTLRKASRVFVVPDSDYLATERGSGKGAFDGVWNPLVRAWTQMAMFTLDAEGVNAVIAVPPPGPDGEKLGIDDFLAQGGSFEELLQQPTRYDIRGLFIPKGVLTPAENRILLFLLKNFGPQGTFYPGWVADQIKVNRKTVQRSIPRLQDLGFLKVWEGKAYYDPEAQQMMNKPHVYSGPPKVYGLGDGFIPWMEEQSGVGWNPTVKQKIMPWKVASD
jgi:hypothetical protein